ncbi:hypothetical protein BGM09_23365 [Streptomyces sp. CBMA29]|nr:hypothetical protein [Streptomyces sp. CBMA29]
MRIIFDASKAIKHSVLFAGQSVRGAGTVIFTDGRVSLIDDQSGHYFPWLGDETGSFLPSGVTAFRNAGVIVLDSAIRPFMDDQ